MRVRILREQLCDSVLASILLVQLRAVPFLPLIDAERQSRPGLIRRGVRHFHHRVIERFNHRTPTPKQPMGVFLA